METSGSTKEANLKVSAFGFELFSFSVSYKCSPHSFPKVKLETNPKAKTIYDCIVKDIHGNDVSMSKYRGRVLLIVNVSSRCHLALSNYREINILYEKYKNEGLEILAFLCYKFKCREQESNVEFQDVLCNLYKAKFPIFEEVEVDWDCVNVAPVYDFLKSQKNLMLRSNFIKFLVDKKGNVVANYASTTSPLNIENDIKKLLRSI